MAAGLACRGTSAGSNACAAHVFPALSVCKHAARARAAKRSLNLSRGARGLTLSHNDGSQRAV